jgi:hypothetical protein
MVLSSAKKMSAFGVNAFDFHQQPSWGMKVRCAALERGNLTRLEILLFLRVTTLTDFLEQLRIPGIVCIGSESFALDTALGSVDRSPIEERCFFNITFGTALSRDLATSCTGSPPGRLDLSPWQNSPDKPRAHALSSYARPSDSMPPSDLPSLPPVSVTFLCRVGPLLSQVEPVKQEFPNGSCAGDAKQFANELPKLRAFELQLTRGAPLNKEDPLPAGNILVEPVLYVQFDPDRLAVLVYVDASRLMVNRILEAIFLMSEGLGSSPKSRRFLRRPTATDALNGDTLVGNLDYRVADKFLILAVFLSMIMYFSLESTERW